MTFLDFSVLSALWLSYFLLHSFLASEGFKQWFKSAFPGAAHVYRLLYNLLASALLLPMLFYIYLVPSQQIIEWNGIFAVIANSIAFAAVVGFIYSLKFYSGMDFLGVTQYSKKTPEEIGNFVISPLHRYVRHPWYLFALMIIWTRDMNAHFLLTACWMTAYFFIGSYFEEQKMKLHFGEQFELYAKKVPGIIPSVRRYLTASQASNLTRKD